jgi:hypothetical protein
LEHRLEQLCARVRASEDLECLADLSDERLQRLLPTRQVSWPGRFVRCADHELGAKLEDLLIPGILLTRRLGQLIMVCRDAEGEPALAITGHPEHLAELVDGAAGLRFAIMPPGGSWKIERVLPRYLRVEGAPWTSFFPWIHVRNSLGLACIVTAIAAMAMWDEHGEFWMPAGGGETGLTERSVEGFLLATVAPGGVAGLVNFVSLCLLGPNQGRSPRSYVGLLAITAVALFFAVALATLHQPINSSH